MTMLKGLNILIQERFHLRIHVPMIFCFCLGNLGLGQLVWNHSPNWIHFAFSFGISFSFFLRLRLFDELKDYETDLRINPTRPLARGALTKEQVKIAIILLLFFELLIAGSFGYFVFFAYVLAAFYSLLMFEEFFIGYWLNRHLTLYALTHTFVSSLLGFAIAANTYQATEFPSAIILIFLMNWGYFNLFEFARKTFATSEERLNVKTYSSQFGLWGAWLLAVSQPLASNILVYFWIESSRFWWQLPVLIFLVYLLLSLWFPLKRTEKAADFFRKVTSLYLLIHYLACFVSYGLFAARWQP